MYIAKLLYRLGQDHRQSVTDHRHVTDYWTLGTSPALPAAPLTIMTDHDGMPSLRQSLCR